MQRRIFIRKSLIQAGVLVAVPYILTSCVDEFVPDTDIIPTDNPITIDLSDPSYSTLLKDGGFVYINKIIVINNAGTYVALSKICTHTGCTISYNAAAKQLPCDCHGSLFDINGNVLTGPAIGALKMYTTSLSDHILSIK